MKFASLGSGSEGNALLISASTNAGGATVMVDCGFPVKETERRLQRLGLLPEQLSAIVVTHEHQDHVGGVFKFARRHRVPVWLTYGTCHAVQKDCAGVALNFCRDGETFEVGNLKLVPYTVPHDAREPVQYVANDGFVKLGILTDAGQPTQHMLEALSGCDALVLECNHDREMLVNSSYPYSLRQRIGGIYGHLSNDAAAEILSALDRSRLKTVVGAHLSRQNNTPQLARAALCGALGDRQVEIVIACQDAGYEWIDLTGAPNL